MKVKIKITGNLTEENRLRRVTDRSSHWRGSIRKDVLKNFSKFVVSSELKEIFKKTFLTEYLWKTASELTIKTATFIATNI